MQKFRTALATIALCLFGLGANAQNVIEQGTSIASVGVGLNPTTFSSPAFTLSGNYEYGWLDNLWDEKSALTIGGYLGTSVMEGASVFQVGPKVGLHYHFIPNLDTYTALFVGFSQTHIGDSTTYRNWLYPSIHVGVRYMFQPNIGVFAETGYGLSVLNIGASFKF